MPIVHAYYCLMHPFTLFCVHEYKNNSKVGASTYFSSGSLDGTASVRMVI